MKKKKIAIFVNSLGGGGAEKVVTILANTFYNEYDLHIILLTNLIEYDVPTEGITIFLLANEPIPPKNKFTDLLKVPFLSYKLKRYLKKNEISTCFSFMYRSNFINSFLKILQWKGEIIISERTYALSNFPNTNLSGRMGRFLIRNLYKYADLILPNSKLIGIDLLRNFGLKNKIEVIYNPVEIDKINIMANQVPSNICFDKFTFICVGRLEPTKGLEGLFNVVASLKNFDFQLLIIGKGSLENYLPQLAVKLGIADKVHFIGFTKNPHKYTKRASCFIMTSTYEGFPNSLLESLALGTPVISTDCPTGPRELLSTKKELDVVLKENELADYGILMPVNNLEKLSEAMILMMIDNELYHQYKNKALQRSREFDVALVMEKYRHVIEEY